MSQVYCVPWPN